MSYEVGQILYTILNDKQIIIPVRVIEQIVIKDLDGETTEYKVLLPNKKNQKVNLEKLQNIFLDLDEVNNFLIERAKKSIDLMIEDAISLEDEYFLIKNNENKKCKNEIKNDIIKNDQIKINLDNGQTANIIDNSAILDEKIVNEIKEEKDKDESNPT
tara:strand:+ start:1915 stop:2388 length:474 start_codon:yes stop_codon:yes gene_type:complete